MNRIRFIYIAYAVIVSAFAAYGPLYVLLLQFLLLPIFFSRKEDFLTPLLTVLATVFTFFYISSTIPLMTTDGQETVTIIWSDNVKIDGGKVKGFAKTSTNDIIYASYKFKTEAEKTYFSELNLPAKKVTLTGSFKKTAIPSHLYAFDMEKYLKMYGASGVFESEEIVNIQQHETVLSRLAKQRYKVKQHIERTFPQSLVTEAQALLIGDRSGMDEAEATVYRRLGITHLFAISGLHVGLLTYMLRELLFRLMIRREMVDSLLIVLLPLYAVLAGGAPSVWRAVSVTVLLLVISLSGRKMRVDNALALSAIVFVMMEPFVLFQPGFQLSYIAAFSLILSGELLRKTTSAIGLSFVVTSISQLSLYPVLLYHFHELSISSFIVNILYVPLYAMVILPANLILLFLSALLLPVAEIVFVFYEPFREMIRIGTYWIAHLPYQLWTPGKPGIYESVFAVAGVIYFFVQYEDGKVLRKCLPFAVIPALLIQLLPYTDGSLRVTFLDVGQGDGAVVELAYKRGVYVIDTGGTVGFGENSWKSPEKSFEVGRKIVVPYLKGRGITKIDKLILSHAHADHMEGADEVLEEIRVGEIHIAPGSAEAIEMVDLLKMIAKKNVPVIEMKDGITWQDEQTRFTYLGPQKGAYVGNDSSLVLLMETTGPSFLFTGDMETEAERKFMQKYNNVDFGQVILKVGHHGSKTSSTEPFIASIKPELAIISAGRNNMYGHPHKEVLDTFEKFDVPVLITAESGSITVIVSGIAYHLSVLEQ